MQFILDILSNEAVKSQIYTNPAIQKLVENYADGSKIALLNSNAEVLLLGVFIEDKDTGLLFSNNTYKQDYYYFYGYEYFTKGYTPEKGSIEMDSSIEMDVCPSCKDILFRIEDTMSHEQRQCINCSKVVSRRKKIDYQLADFECGGAGWSA